MKQQHFHITDSVEILHTCHFGYVQNVVIFTITSLWTTSKQSTDTVVVAIKY